MRVIPLSRKGNSKEDFYLNHIDNIISIRQQSQRTKGMSQMRATNSEHYFGNDIVQLDPHMI